MWGWIIIAVIVLWALGRIKRGPNKKRTRRSTTIRDDSAMYWAMQHRSEKIRERFDVCEANYYDVPSKWPLLIKAFDSWLKQEEEIMKARFTCVEGKMHSPYPIAPDGLFDVLVRSGNEQDAFSYAERLSVIDACDKTRMRSMIERSIAERNEPEPKLKTKRQPTPR